MSGPGQGPPIRRMCCRSCAGSATGRPPTRPSRPATCAPNRSPTTTRTSWTSQSRQLMCTCRGCRLLFTADGAHLRYRAVPDRYLSFPDFALTEAGWDALDIPVGLAFFFASSVTGRMGAFYPGPAGVAESELGLRAWSDVVAANPELDVLAARRRGPACPRPRRRSTGRVLPGADRRLLRARRPAAYGLAWFRRWSGRAVGRSPSSSARWPIAPSPGRALSSTSQELPVDGPGDGA